MIVFLFCPVSLLMELVKRMFLMHSKLLIQQLFFKLDCTVAWILEMNVACSFRLEGNTLVSFEFMLIIKNHFESIIGRTSAKCTEDWKSYT